MSQFLPKGTSVQIFYYNSVINQYKLFERTLWYKTKIDVALYETYPISYKKDNLADPIKWFLNNYFVMKSGYEELFDQGKIWIVSSENWNDENIKWYVCFETFKLNKK